MPGLRPNLLLLALLALGLCPGLHGTANATGDVARALITMPIDEARLVKLEGNTRPEASAANDRGRVPDSLVLEHLQLLLRRPVERQVALESSIAAA